MFTKVFLFVYATGRMFFTWNYDQADTTSQVIMCRPVTEPTYKLKPKDNVKIGDTVFVNIADYQGDWFEIVEFQH